MGEYAKRKVDQAEVKIGTCSSMYYMTPSQIFDIDWSSYNIGECFQELYFRIWLPCEENVLVGDFYSHKVDTSRTRFMLEPTDEDIAMYRSHPSLVRQSVQSDSFKSKYNKRSETGLEVSFQCCHGYNDDIPRNEQDSHSLGLINKCQKNNVFCLEQIRFVDKEPTFIASCGICGAKFCYSYEEFKRMKFYEYNTFEDHEEYIDLKNYINSKLYNLQFGEDGEFYKRHIDFSKLLPYIPEPGEKNNKQ